MCSPIPYLLTRSRRRTLAITVDGEGRLVVRAPMRLGKDFIHDFIRRKARWIEKQQRRVAELKAAQKAFELKDGERVMYLGKPHTLFRGMVMDVTVADDCIYVPDDMTLDGFVAWLRERSRSVIAERVEHYARRMGLRYASVRVSGARRRWGSCGAGNTLNFAWRLVSCPLSVIDYVAVHELSHIPHKGHGAKFWQCVAATLPDYRKARTWLRRNRHLLDMMMSKK